MRGRRKDLPPLEFLIAFEAAARLGSFTGAAEELNLTQAAVSRQIRLLEQNLGRSLFTRAHRAVHLTPEGRDFQHTVSLALSHIANAARGLRVVDGNAKLTVAADQSVAALWLLPRLQSFQREHGDISVRLISSDVEADCLAEDVDLAIVHGDGNWPGFEAELLLDEEVFPVCSPAYLERHGAIAQPADLLERVLIDLDDDHWNWINWRVWLTEQTADLSQKEPGNEPGNEPGSEPGNQLGGLRRLVINSYPLIVQAARDGLGVALGWKHLVDEPLAAGALARPLEQSVRTEFGYFLLMRQDREASPQAEVFRDWLRGRPAVE
jgi:DNA-binding transcriptional LysR family regulator